MDELETKVQGPAPDHEEMLAQSEPIDLAEEAMDMDTDMTEDADSAL